MLHQILFGVVVFGLLNGLFGSIAVRRTAHLEQKLGVLWRALLTQGLALVVLGAGMVVHARDLPRLNPGASADTAQLSAHLLEVRAHAENGWLAMAALVFVVGMLLPMALHVLSEVRTFVLEQRVDLLGRDQAAAFGEPSHPKR